MLAAGLTPAVVHTQMARLRRDIGGEQVVRSEVGYRVTGVDVDADRFTDLVARARGSEPPATTVTLLREALGLWRGDRPYADVTEELVAAEVTRILALRTVTRELLAERLLQRGDREAIEEAAGLADLLAAQDPMRERGHELAILAAARAGRRAEALERYDVLRRTLRDELGIDPGPDAQALQLQVLRDELAPAPSTRPRAEPDAGPGADQPPPRPGRRPGAGPEACCVSGDWSPSSGWAGSGRAGCSSSWRRSLGPGRRRVRRPGAAARAARG